MIKIISGKYKGRNLHDVPDKYVRPTQAKVRKSMLQILEPFHGLKVLDLFAGVGTLGIEALSRGAIHLTSVEKNSLVFQNLLKNIETICSTDDVVLKQYDVNRFLSTSLEMFDVIIADPPYGKFSFEELLELVKPHLVKDGVFCMETKRCTIDETINVRIKKYGNTHVLFWRNVA